MLLVEAYKYIPSAFSYWHKKKRAEQLFWMTNIFITWVPKSFPVFEVFSAQKLVYSHSGPALPILSFLVARWTSLLLKYRKISMSRHLNFLAVRQFHLHDKPLSCQIPLTPMGVLAHRLCTLDRSLVPPSAWAEIFPPTCLQSHL